MAKSTVEQIADLLGQGGAQGEARGVGRGRVVQQQAEGAPAGGGVRGARRMTREELRGQVAGGEGAGEGGGDDDGEEGQQGAGHGTARSRAREASREDEGSEAGGGEDSARAAGEEEGAGEGGTEGDDAGAGESGDGDKPVTLRELAEQFGVSAADLYHVAVDMGPEDASDPKSPHVFSTIEELKAAGREVGELRRQVGDIVQARTEVELERNAALREVYAIGEVLRRHGVELSPQLRQAAESVQEEYVQRERGKLLAHLPDWKKGDVRAAERAVIVKQFARRFGISEEELAAVTSHKFVLAMRRAALDWEAADKARVSSQAKLEGNGQPGRHRQERNGAGAAARLRAAHKRAKSGGKSDKVNYVAKLIGG